ncbi:hypothetical protein HanPSC8_Chr05g0189821 [Helianthus annuus]|nr:hypothetical protein HanPSC8_Chr05g0189821 [Helianthus annuus]
MWVVGLIGDNMWCVDVVAGGWWWWQVGECGGRWVVVVAGGWMWWQVGGYGGGDGIDGCGLVRLC